MSSGDDGDPSSNADEGSEENLEGNGSDNAALPIEADYSSELTSDGRKTTSSSPTETDTNSNEDDYYDDDDDDYYYDDTDFDDSETSDDRKPSPNQQSEEEKSGAAANDDRNLSSSNLANRNKESFPCTLLLMLNNEATAGGKSIKWLPGGGGFEIIDQNALEKDILPKYFPSSCMFQSFVRRLYRNDGSITSSSVGLPSQLAMTQSEVTSQLNSIISSYSNNPMMLTALQNTISNVLTSQVTFGGTQNPMAPNANFLSQVSSLSSQSMPRQVENSFGTDNQAQLRGNEIVENVLRFLTQGQQTNTSHSNAVTVLPPTIHHSPLTVPAMPMQPQPQPQYPGEPVLQSNDPTVEYATSHYSVDQMTTNTSTSSQHGQVEYQKDDFETSESDNTDRKRQRSPSPQD
eukprot:CCRYP_000057-RA/>CCRYP_000057-RA protein AED:0.18 eAED:-0.00 QI:0/0/0/1/0/0.5/2/0/403